MSLSKFNHVKISGITAVVPDNRINIDDELSFYDNDIKKLERNKKILGLGTRYVVPEGVTMLDLCEASANNLIEEMKINKDEIDALIVVSICHDYHSPASACILHGKLGLNESCACFDTAGLSCSGYVHGLWLAHSLIASGAIKKCLLLVGDTNSMHSDKKNRISNMLYSDAGSATLIEYTKEENTAYFNLGTKGDDWNKIVTPSSGCRLPIRKDIIDFEMKDENGNVWHLWDEVLKGMDIFKFTMEYAPKSAKELIDYSGISLYDIDFVAMHQANGQIVKMIAQHMGVDKDKYSNETFTKYANCGAASIVTNLCDQALRAENKEIMMVTFGVGLSWATSIINVCNVYNGGIKLFDVNYPRRTREELIIDWGKYFKGEIYDVQR